MKIPGHDDRTYKAGATDGGSAASSFTSALRKGAAAAPRPTGRAPSDAVQARDARGADSQPGPGPTEGRRESILTNLTRMPRASTPATHVRLAPPRERERLPSPLVRTAAPAPEQRRIQLQGGQPGADWRR